MGSIEEALVISKHYVEEGFQTFIAWAVS